LACGFAFTQQLGFYAVAHESVFFMSYRKKRQHREHVFAVLQGRKQLATIAICKLLIARSNDEEECIMSYCKKQQH
jgi:hypothetical protein